MLSRLYFESSSYRPPVAFGGKSRRVVERGGGGHALAANLLIARAAYERAATLYASESLGRDLRPIGNRSNRSREALGMSARRTFLHHHSRITNPTRRPRLRGQMPMLRVEGKGEQ